MRGARSSSRLPCSSGGCGLRSFTSSGMFSGSNTARIGTARCAFRTASSTLTARATGSASRVSRDSGSDGGEKPRWLTAEDPAKPRADRADWLLTSLPGSLSLCCPGCFGRQRPKKPPTCAARTVAGIDSDTLLDRVRNARRARRRLPGAVHTVRRPKSLPFAKGSKPSRRERAESRQRGRVPSVRLAALTQYARLSDGAEDRKPPVLTAACHV